MVFANRFGLLFSGMNIMDRLGTLLISSQKPLRIKNDMWILLGVTSLLLAAMIYTVLKLVEQSEEHVDSVRGVRVKLSRADLRPEAGEADVALARLIDENPYRTELAFQHWDLTKENMKSIGKLKTLETLSLSDCTFKDSWLRYVDKLPLVKLDLSGTLLTDDGCKYIAKMKTLKVLHIHDTGVSGKCLEILKPLNELTTLSLSGTSFNDDDAERLLGFQNVTELNLSGTFITAKGCETLAKMEKLRMLDLSRMKVTKQALLNLKDLPGLQDLRLKASSIDDDAASVLPQFQKIANLDLNENNVSDRSLDAFGTMKSLEHLNVKNNPLVTRAGAARFRKAKPSTGISFGASDRSGL